MNNALAEELRRLQGIVDSMTVIENELAEARNVIEDVQCELQDIVERTRRKDMNTGVVTYVLTNDDMQELLELVGLYARDDPYESPASMGWVGWDGRP